ncbi:hypothetical protein ACH4LK_36510 [Streptomyces lydicus]|uniref:hypothetical protein n=1 Tax=Streptomyces lydicus TaxID=47763 RepID=UPI0037A2D426
MRQSHRCEIEPDLADYEFDRIEAEYGFRFSDDHRAFLSAGLPVSSPPEEGDTWDSPWPNWRNGDADDLRSHLTWPTEGALRSVEHGYWHATWGQRPTEPHAAKAAAERHLAVVPSLVPVYAHRFLPAGYATHRHPVLSIWGTDIIYYRSDLADYVDSEFNDDHDRDWESWAPEATVPFWRDFLG